MSTTSAYSSPILSTFPFDALTTTFTPPPACSGVYTSAGIAVIDDDLRCLPQGFTSSSTNYFSPGLLCPSGYVTACNDNKGVASVTTVTCCPHRGDITLGCVTPSTLEGAFETLFCTWIAPESGSEVPVTVSNDGTTSTTQAVMSSPGGINAYGVRMVYESSDVSSAAAATTTTSGQQKGTGTGTNGAPTATTTGAGSGDSGSADNGSGLSIGAVIAVAVVIPVVVIGAAAAIFFFIRTRKQRQRIRSTTEPIGPAGGPPSAPGFTDQKTYYGAAGAGFGGAYQNMDSPNASAATMSAYGSKQNPYQDAVELGDREPAVELPDQTYR